MHNLSTKFFLSLVFKRDSFPMLLASGLVNAYIDDYGYRCRYHNCLLVLFNTNAKYYPILEEKLSGFQAFHDWYDVNEHLRMLVFKIGIVYKKDFYNVKHMVDTNYSEEFKKVTNLQENLIMDIDHSKEIYRYNL